MKSRNLLIAAALALVVVAVVVYKVTRPSSKSSDERAATGSGAGSQGPLVARDTPSAASLTGGALPTGGPGAGQGSGPAVKVERNGSLATVNGVAIRGGDMMAWRADYGDSVEMTPEMHEFLTQRAIDRELTFQAAKARNLELTALQREQLAQVRANATARGETDPAQIDFEEKEARAQMLLGTMAAADGAPPAMVDDAAVDRYLREHADELGPAPTDPQAAQQRRIDVRQKLYAEQTAEHEAHLREYLDRLAQAAQIDR